MNNKWSLIGGLVILASLSLASCGSPSSGVEPDMTSLSVGDEAKAVRSREVSVVIDEIGGDDFNSSYVDDFEAVSLAGGMVLKLDVALIDARGFMTPRTSEDLIVFEDPSCTECLDLKPWLSEAGFGFVSAPVAFYSEEGLDLVAGLICEANGFDSMSEACGSLIRGMSNNTGTLMVQGIVDLPAALLPNGWLIEGITSREELMALRKGSNVE